MKDMPLYKTIYEDLRQKIENGTYSENAALPSERVLCQMYHVSRSTMRSALDELYRKNYTAAEISSNRRCLSGK